MHRRHVLIATLLVLATALPCRAVTIIAKDREQPIKGYLISENDTRVVVDELLPDGTTNRLTLPRTAIELLINPVSSERLAELNRDAPQAYRDYADELFEKREDPDARATAIRLYLIAAWLDPQGLGRSCLLGMAALARDPGEERRFRAMGYLLDPAHDRAALRPPAVEKIQVDLVTEPQKALVLEALRALRSGDKETARNIAKRPGFKPAIEPFSGLVTLSDITESAGSDSPVIRPGLLKKLLQVELLLTGSPAARPADKPDDAPLPWSQLIATHHDRPASPLSLETVSEFDPRECHFKDGKWVAP